MRIGVTMFVTDTSIGPVELAVAAEERGLDSLFVPEHTHIPASRKTPAPMGEPLPDQYYRCMDPFVSLTAAATATRRLRVGTGICLVAQRDPIITAKEVASLDRVSGGRFVFGIGFGWNEDELEDHGVRMRDRRAVVRERMLAMEALWRDEVASFDGEHVRLSPSYAWPKPVQQPRPPVLIGGAPGPALFSHIAEYADGWIPIGGGGVRDALPQLHGAVEQAGRDPASISIVPFFVAPTREKLEYYAGFGATEVVCGLPSAGPDRVLPELDVIAELVDHAAAR